MESSLIAVPHGGAAILVGIFPHGSQETQRVSQEGTRSPE